MQLVGSETITQPIAMSKRKLAQPEIATLPLPERCIAQYLCALLAHYRSLSIYWNSGEFPTFYRSLFPCCFSSVDLSIVRKRLLEMGWIKRMEGSRCWFFTDGRALKDLMREYGVASMDEGRILQHTCAPVERKSIPSAVRTRLLQRLTNRTEDEPAKKKKKNAKKKEQEQKCDDCEMMTPKEWTAADARLLHGLMWMVESELNKAS
jgi:hypothetical protein